MNLDAFSALGARTQMHVSGFLRLEDCVFCNVLINF